MTWVHAPDLACSGARFGAQFEVPMPDAGARRAIMRLILGNHARETAPQYCGQPSVEAGLLEARGAAPTHASCLRCFFVACP